PEDLRPLPRGKSWPSRAPGAPAPVAGCRAPHEPRGRPVHIGPRTRGSGKCHARGGTCRVLAPRTPRSAAAAGREQRGGGRARGGGHGSSGGGRAVAHCLSTGGGAGRPRARGACRRLIPGRWRGVKRPGLRQRRGVGQSPRWGPCRGIFGLESGS
ncbi:unnamed protein product, partial [Prorocentrum cordatum]